MAGRSPQKKSNDFTGKQAAELSAKAAEEKAQAAERMATMTAEKQQRFEDEVQNMTVTPQRPTVVDEVVEIGVVLADDSMVVRVAEDIENMTFGYGNTYTFKAGGKYKVPKNVADRLQTLGLLYERL